MITFGKPGYNEKVYAKEKTEMISIIHKYGDWNLIEEYGAHWQSLYKKIEMYMYFIDNTKNGKHSQAEISMKCCVDDCDGDVSWIFGRWCDSHGIAQRMVFEMMYDRWNSPNGLSKEDSFRVAGYYMDDIDRPPEFRIT